MNFSYKVIGNGKQVEICHSHSKRHFCTRLALINWHLNHLKVYLRVSYGKRMDNFGKLVTFYNDGWYENKKDFWLAFDAFTEND